MTPDPVQPATVTTPATTTPPRTIGGPLSGADDPQIIPGDGETWSCACGEPGCSA